MEKPFQRSFPPGKTDCSNEISRRLLLPGLFENGILFKVGQEIASPPKERIGSIVLVTHNNIKWSIAAWHNHPTAKKYITDRKPL